MENELSTDDGSKTSRDNSIKDCALSRGSVKSTKSSNKSVSSLSNTSLTKQEKDVHFIKSSVKTKTEKHDNDHFKHNTDASLKVPQKIIANWKQACDRTRDRTRDLLKRWRTLPEYEIEENAKKNQNFEKTDSQVESGWSVHVWSKYLIFSSRKKKTEELNSVVKLYSFTLF